MPNKLNNYIEKIFRESTSGEELFDAFNLAVKNNIDDAELYKILMANLTLSIDEIKLFTEKLCSQFENMGYDLCHWTGYIFHLRDEDLSYINSAFYYYQKAFLLKPDSETPLISALKLYNYEYDLPTNESVMQLVNTGVKKVKNKSMVYKEMSKHFNKLGNEELARKYALLAAKNANKKNQ